MSRITAWLRKAFGTLSLVSACVGWTQLASAAISSPSYAAVVATVQPKMVKVFGAGGLRNLESYQSGFLISDDGFVLTAWSYVLDTGQATVILDDGRRFVAEITGADPRTELAILKIGASDLPHFSLEDAVPLVPGARVLAFSNLYGVATGDEPTSVLHGVVSGITRLAARRGSFETPYKGRVYVLDAMTNNAGAAGGALTDSRGRLAAMLGKELRDSRTNAWLNYAQPIAELRSSIESILTGKETHEGNEASGLPEEFAELDSLGIILIPNILRNTPPFIDAILPGSLAAKTDLKSDDLIVLINGNTVSSQTSVDEELRRIDVVDPVRITVVRDSELVEIEIEPLK